ncbi:hypothetical protein ACV3QH_17000 [Clostridium perfringens]
MRVIENSKKSKNFNLKEFNNFENKTTEFFNFICELCRKYNMKIYKVVKTYSNDKNMGVQLNSINGHANIFYNYNKKMLEIEVEGENSSCIESDIVKYAITQKYNKNDKVVDEFGNTCILNEDIELGKISKRINVTRVKDGKTYFIYGSSIVPCIDE